MKKVIIIAGPNGAGKTTFAEEYLPNEGCCPEFVNADLIAAGLSPFHPERVAVTAGRLMLKRIDELVSAGESFALETTLASKLYLRLIPKWQAEGYVVQLFFLCLPNSETAKSRVKQRIALGGHAIPEVDIIRRFERGLRNLRNDYRKVVDQWFLYDGSTMPPTLLESGEKGGSGIVMEGAAAYSYDLQKSDVQTLDEVNDGALAALKRGAEKAVARARAHGLEPVVSNPEGAKEE